MVKSPEAAKITLPTFVKWFHLRHNGLDSGSVGEEATHAESGGLIHGQGLAAKRHDHQRHRSVARGAALDSAGGVAARNAESRVAYAEEPTAPE
jgi:hypothetical protein